MWVSVGVAGRVVSPNDDAHPGLSLAARSSFVRDHETDRLRAEAWLIDYRAKSNAARARRYDANALVEPFKAGDWVLMHIPIAIKAISQKLIDKFRDPYRVVGPHTSRTDVSRRTPSA